MTAWDRTPLSVDDAAAVVELANRADLRWLGEPLIEVEDLISELTAPGLDLERDTSADRAADGTLGSAAILGPRGRLDLFLDPPADPARWTALADHYEELARDRGLPTVHQFVPRADTATAERISARGYRLDYTAWILRLTDRAALATRTLPPGYAIRPFDDADARVVHTVIRDAFGEWDAGPPHSFEDWSAETLRRPGVDTGNFRVATYEGEVIGTCIVYDSGTEAWISQLATVRAHRGRGVAQQLLAETFRAARERGLPDGGLSTDTRTGALGLYERLGMEVRNTIDCWTLDLGSR